jgi:hypothetical protein
MSISTKKSSQLLTEIEWQKNIYIIEMLRESGIIIGSSAIIIMASVIFLMPPLLPLTNFLLIAIYGLIGPALYAYSIPMKILDYRLSIILNDKVK